MDIQSTYLHLPDFLNESDLSQINTLSKQTIYEDGKHTATDAARSVKSNLQMNAQSREYMAVQQIIMAAMNRNNTFRSAVIPKNVYPFIISKYANGMNYGWHVDSPLMGNMMRTDVAMTIFLSDPADYEGGELELQAPTGNLLYKLNKGDAICYPCTQVHRVREVISGERHVAVTWIQSMVKQTEQRTILFDLQQAINHVQTTESNGVSNLLQQTYSNILRMWTE